MRPKGGGLAAVVLLNRRDRLVGRKQDRVALPLAGVGTDGVELACIEHEGLSGTVAGEHAHPGGIPQCPDIGLLAAHAPQLGRCRGNRIDVDVGANALTAVGHENRAIRGDDARHGTGAARWDFLDLPLDERQGLNLPIDVDMRRRIAVGTEQCVIMVCARMRDDKSGPGKLLWNGEIRSVRGRCGDKRRGSTNLGSRDQRIRRDGGQLTVLQVQKVIACVDAVVVPVADDAQLASARLRQQGIIAIDHARELCLLSEFARFVDRVDRGRAFQIRPRCDVDARQRRAEVGLARIRSVGPTGSGFSNPAVGQRHIGALGASDGDVLGIERDGIAVGEIRRRPERRALGAISVVPLTRPDRLVGLKLQRAATSLTGIVTGIDRALLAGIEQQRLRFSVACQDSDAGFIFGCGDVRRTASNAPELAPGRGHGERVAGTCSALRTMRDEDRLVGPDDRGRAMAGAGGNGLDLAGLQHQGFNAVTRCDRGRGVAEVAQQVQGVRGKNLGDCEQGAGEMPRYGQVHAIRG